MKNKALFLLLLVAISFFCCKSAIEIPAIPISNIDIDFPITETLEFKPFNKYDIFTEGFRVIDDSILWSFEEGKYDFGSCYNLDTGEKLATIVSRGRAANELTRLEYFDIIGDSVLLYAGQNTIKTFAKKDIIDNIPMGERKFSVITAPDSILVYRMAKLPNGSVLATIEPALDEFNKGKINEFNQKSVALFTNKEANSYETINYESFDIEEAESAELSTNDLIKCAYSNGAIGVKNSDMAVFSVWGQFILYTFDIKNGNVVNEKRYTKMQRTTGGKGTFKTTNDRHLSIEYMQTNDKYIMCAVYGYLSEEDRKNKLTKAAIFVFDWELNPIKRFDFSVPQNIYYTISKDCSSVYSCELNEEGLLLYKADLNI